MRLHLSPVLALLAACAPAVAPVHVPTPAELTAIRRQAARDPSPEAQVALATAWRAAGQRDSARQLLEGVVRTHPRHPSAVLALGLTADEQGDYATAEARYREYLALARGAPLKRDVERRLVLVRRQALAVAVRRALASEAALSKLPPDPGALAVFPFSYSGQDARMQSLSRALAALLTTDLAQTDRVKVLERTEIQALLGELKLSQSGLVDPATAVRSGRLLRAGRVVQGQLGGSDRALQIAAAVVRVENGRRVNPVQVEDELARLFEMEKTLAFGLYRSMGIELTVAERERVAQRPTQNVEALLEFGWGLQAEEAGQPEAAARHFKKALQFDPGFTAARDRAGEATAAAEGPTTDQLERRLTQVVPVPALLLEGFRPQTRATVGLDPGDILLPDPIVRSPGAELLGADDVSIPATLVILITLGRL